MPKTEAEYEIEQKLSNQKLEGFLAGLMLTSVFFSAYCETRSIFQALLPTGVLAMLLTWDNPRKTWNNLQRKLAMIIQGRLKERRGR